MANLLGHFFNFYSENRSWRIKKEMRLLSALTTLAAALAAAPRAGDYGECENCKWDEETVEMLVFKVAGHDVQAWIDADDRIWRTFLAEQDGYKSKAVYVAQTCDLTKSDLCQVT